MSSLYIDAGNFVNYGGWVLDTLPMGKIGAACLMAHGLGMPVPDACTDINIKTAGRYHIYVRTRNWTAKWERGTPAGRFTLLIDGQALPQELGTNGEDWSWQKAGVLKLASGRHRLALHDLTGFNGRCAAIYLSDQAADVPPDGLPECEAFRLERIGASVVEAPEEYDLLVAGGGIAGTVTALAAARLGLKAVLLQDKSVLGGCNSSEIRVPLGGCTHVQPYPNIGNTVREIAPICLNPRAQAAQCYEDDRKAFAFNVTCLGKAELRLNEYVMQVEMEAERIVAVIARNTRTGQDTRYRARFFADCTGDGAIAVAAGAGYMYGTEGYEVYQESLAPEESSREVMGMSMLWTSKDEEQPVPFPDIDWGIPFNEDFCSYVTFGDWEAESGQYRNQAEEAEYIRDYALMTTFGNWSWLKNHSRRKAEWANKRILWMTSCGGKRESRRFIGDYVMTQHDIEDGIKHRDGTASITWSIDLHYPEPRNKELFGDEPFRSCAYHRDLPAFIPVPYRCLYAKDVQNLFLGGRLISMSHVAFSAVRVMRTLGCLGEVVAMAAAVCVEKDTTPRGVYRKFLSELKRKMRAGIPIPQQFACPSVGDTEAYHFQNVGFFRYRPDGKIHNLAPEIQAEIRKLGKKNLYPHTGK